MVKKILWTCIVVTLLGLTPSFAATNAAMNFKIYIDNTSPTYTDYSGLSLIENIDQTFYCYALWSDNQRLNAFKFEWDKDGAATNDTATPFINGWSNVSKTFTGADENKTINYRIHGYDGMGNTNTTSYRQLVTASIKPEISELNQDNNSPIIGDSVKVSSLWADNFEVDHVYLQTNETGSWHDNGSPINIDSRNGWANFTIDTTGMNTSPYFWRVTGYDQVGNDNTSPIQYFTPQE